MGQVHVINKFEDNPYPEAVEIDTTSRGAFKDLSPFFVGPVTDPHTGEICQNFENFWQYHKVYKEHANAQGLPDTNYWEWRRMGYANHRAVRYPMGKGRKPLGSWFGNQMLDYITAWKLIYAPYYADLVRYTKSYNTIFNWCHNEGRDLVLRDFDGYDRLKFGMSLVDVMNSPTRKHGHAFILAGMLTGQLENMKAL